MRFTKFENPFGILGLIVIFLLTGSVIRTEAEPITVDQAKQNVISFLKSPDGRYLSKSSVELKLVSSEKNLLDSSPAFYVFNIGSNGGFVIASGDDVAEPILGFCERDSFDPNNIPDPMRGWLEECTNQIHWARQMGLKVSDSPLNEPYKANMATSVSSMVNCKWNQHAPYDKKCVFNGVTCATGCFSVAMAGIVYYWGTKGNSNGMFKCGSKVVPGYVTTTYKYTVPQLPALTSFDFDNMTAKKPTTTASKNAVSQLMRYCGQAAKANYSPSASSVSINSVPTALKKSFGFNLGMKVRKASEMTLAEWKSLIYNEIVSRRPVLMMGTGSAGTHGFVCDGYNASTGKFHFVWGWDGSYDGYYTINAIKITLLSGSVLTFNSGQMAVVNINPFEKNSYAQLSSDKTTLTFYHDAKAFSRAGTTYELNTTSSAPGWKGLSSIKKVVFNSTFASARPVSTYYWFYNLPNLTTISYLKYLNTSKTTNMGYMFYKCTNLSSLDVSTFNTAAVTNMNYMFYGCSKLASLDLSNFNMKKVTASNYMLAYCSALKSLSVPASMSSVHSLALYGVGKTTSPCIITAPSGFSFGVTTSALYFTWKKGYCFLSGTKLPYAQLSSSNLTFHYDATPWSKTGTIYSLNTGTNAPSWYAKRESVTSVTFNSTFASARPTTTAKWFYNMSNLTSVTGTGYLNMSKVSSTTYMFYGCSKLASVTLPSTMKTIGSYAFYKCSSLASITVPSAVTSLGAYSFYNCTALAKATLPASVTSIGNYSFYGCSKLTTVKVGFSTPPTIIAATFSNRKNSYLYVPSGSVNTFKAAAYWKEFKYIKVASSQAAPEIDADEETDQVDGIEQMTTEVVSDVKKTIYTIDGRLVRKNATTEGLPSGIYIIDGKKVVLK